MEVTASWWDVTDFQIQDKMPEALSYSGYRVVSNEDKLTVTWPTWPVKSWSNNIYTWNVRWTLKEGHVLTIEVETEVNKMPKSEDDYLNIACVLDDGKIDCDEDEPPVKWWKLDVVKTLISEDKYVSHTWQALDWKVTITAKNWDVELETITDKYPSDLLSYSGYKTIWNWEDEWIKIINSEDDKKGRVVWNVSWTLQSWHKIELIVYTTVKVMPEKEVVNVACAKPVDPWQKECGTWHIHDLRIKKHILDKNNKLVKQITWNVGDAITYVIEFGNDWDEPATVILKDYLPKWVEFISGTLVVGWAKSLWTTWVENLGMMYEWKTVEIQWVNINLYESVRLAANQSWTLIIKWKILESKEENYNRTNFACIFDNDGNRIDCDDAHHDVEPNEVMCKSVTSGNKDSCTETSWEASVTCETDWWKADLIEIFCDWENLSAKGSGEKLTTICTYTRGNTYKPLCKVNWKEIDKNWNVCEWSYTFTKPSGCWGWWGWGWWWGTTPTKLSCENMTYDKNDWKVVCKASKKSYIRIDCWNGTVYTSEDNDSKTYEKTCRWPSTPKCYVSSDKESWISSYDCWDLWCFNVNAWNFSIEEWEILPFYWNMNNMDKIYQDTSNYTEIDGDYKNSEQKYENPNLYECTENKEWKIAKDSMICKFNIYDGDHNADNPLYTIEWPCLAWDSDSLAIKQKSLIDSWYKTMIKEYCNNNENNCDFHYSNNNKGILFPTAVYYIENFWSKATVPSWHTLWGSRELNWNLDAENNKAFWEYKIELSEVKYLVCKDNKWEQETNNNSCQNDFVLTNSYTVQKTPSGNLTASTEKLSKYKYINGTETFAKLLNAISTSEYNKNDNVQKAMNNFISKYEKLAVKVNVNNNSKLQWSNIKKVPGKDIYFVDGDVTIKWSSSEIKNAFTIVQKGVNNKAIIEWNVLHNMMLLSEWNIEFKWNCTTDQNVKWIFYAWGSLSRNSVDKNKDIDIAQWCTNGWLHIQWVLIWNGFNNLMDGSRSNLNGWFKVSWSESEIKNQRRNLIMNWASVLIEYSPSIFTKSTMPPGAEDFTTALSIYKN